LGGRSNRSVSASPIDIGTKTTSPSRQTAMWSGTRRIFSGSRRILSLGTGFLASAVARAYTAEAHSSPLRPDGLNELDARVSALELQERRRPVVVCGPSGVGKGTLLNRLMKEYPDEFGFSVSHTTRAPRVGEQDGVHYHFCDKEKMEAMIANGEFIEYARVHSNIYGTSIAGVSAVSSAGKTCLLDIDVQGAELVKRTNLNARFLFVAPPSFADLEQRLRGRGTETEEKIQLRLKNAHGEMAYLEKPEFFHAVIVNDNLDKAYAELKQVLLVPSRPTE